MFQSPNHYRCCESASYTPNHGELPMFNVNSYPQYICSSLKNWVRQRISVRTVKNSDESAMQTRQREPPHWRTGLEFTGSTGSREAITGSASWCNNFRR